jgi:hypothetical protein
VRLQVAEAPQRLHFGSAGEARPLGHDHGWVFRRDDGQVDGQREGGNIGRWWGWWRAAAGTRNERRCGLKLACVAGEVEAAVRFVDVYGPAAGADQPRDGDAAAEIAQVIAAGAAHHPLGVATAVELRAAFPEAQNRRGTGGEGDAASLSVDRDSLNGFALSGFNGKGQRVGCEGHAEAAELHCLGVHRATQARRGSSEACLYERSIVGDAGEFAVLDGLDGDPEGVRADGGELDLDILPRNT